MQAMPFTILIDGECPLCRREADLLARMDKGRKRLVIQDITAPGFSAERYGTTFEAVMGQIHGVLPDGSLIVGMEVFRRAYAAVGWGWIIAPTGWPIIKPVVDRAYRWFARNRLRITGRSCDSGRCAIR